MTGLTKIETHVEDGLARLLSRWRGSPRMVAFVRIILERVQHLEDVLWDVYTLSWLDTAEGVQLDALGAIVGEPRKGRQDDQYRLYIRARVTINRSNGRIDDTLKVARLILESTATVEYTPEYPAAYRVDVTNTAVTLTDLVALLNAVRPAGVGLTTVFTSDLAHTLVWDSTDPNQIWDAGEWSDSI